MRKSIPSLVLICGLWFGVSAQAAQQSKTLERDKPVEREIAGGESHTYRLPLQAGQFLRLVLEQKGIDVAVTLSGPDGKQLVEANLSSGAFGREQLSHEVAVSGDYKIVVHPLVATAPQGSYQVQLEVNATTTV